MAIEQRASDSAPDLSGRAPASASGALAPPQLENGDRLTRSEFERRYEAMPQLKKAELIEGVVYVPSPVRHDQHGQPYVALTTWVGTYWMATPGTTSAGDSTVRLDLDSEPQPDVLLRIDRGGRSEIGPDGYVEGTPELVIEVAASSASYDLHDKLRVYRRNGVLEYLIWRVLDRAFDWLVLRDDTYERLEPDEHGVLRSGVFPGLWLNVPALLIGDHAALMATLQEGLASPEHAAFVERLREAVTRPAPSPES